MNLLKIKNLNKAFKRQDNTNLEVLKDINLNIKSQEFITLIGPSGCGKSTLLNILAGLTKPDTGKVLLKNKLITRPDNDRVMVFQDSALFPWLNVIDNVTFGLSEKNIDKVTAYKKAENILKSVNLKDFKDAYPHQLSGGMKQRVAIARALILDPKILLMDEPFGALDEQTRIILQKELIKLWLETKKTIIFVTHNIREAVKLSDRIVVLSTNPGKILDQIYIDIPRPRNQNNTKLIRIENRILNLLQNELMSEGDYLDEKIAT